MGFIGMSNYRNKKLTQSAKHEACVSCGADDGTIVWAHSNSQRHGKGMGIKAHDLFGAYLCHRCHERFDKSDKVMFVTNSGAWSKNGWFLEQWEKSMIIACEKGYI
jgi:hypothetical protein